MLLQQVQRLEKTVNDLLFFGKPSVPELACIDISHVIEKTLTFASQHRGVVHIGRQLEFTPGLPTVYADGKQMQQVFLNLILNAFQAMGEGGTLTISTSLAERQGRDYVRIDVADTGSGIPPQIQEKIFTPFFTTKAQGTGLGLPICYKLINLHSGFLTVANNVPRGTVFTIELPACNVHDFDEARREHET